MWGPGLLSGVTHPCPRLSWEERSGEAARLRPAPHQEKQTCFQQVLALRSLPAPLPLAGGGVFLARLGSAVGCVRQQSPVPGGLCWEPGTRVGRLGFPESLCPRNNLAHARDEGGLDLPLSNPQPLQRMSQNLGRLENQEATRVAPDLILEMPRGLQSPSCLDSKKKNH